MAQTQEYLVRTYKSSCAVKAKIKTDGTQVPIYIVGYDSLNPNTLYFRSRFLITGEEEVTLNCPQSPITLNVVIWSGGDLKYQVVSISLVSLPNAVKSTDPSVIFIESFARRAGRLRPGVYGDTNVPFKIDYRREIYRDNGTVHPTPARIHTQQPIIQASKTKFNQMTVPERVIILLHEMAHNFINRDQDDEVESDAHALNIYKTLGYPKIEAVNAFANIMSDTDNNYKRMQNLINI